MITPKLLKAETLFFLDLFVYFPVFYFYGQRVDAAVFSLCFTVADGFNVWDEESLFAYTFMFTSVAWHCRQQIDFLAVFVVMFGLFSLMTSNEVIFC